jgi:hypothetical protein
MIADNRNRPTLGITSLQARNRRPRQPSAVELPHNLSPDVHYAGAICWITSMNSKRSRLRTPNCLRPDWGRGGTEWLSSPEPKAGGCHPARCFLDSLSRAGRSTRRRSPNRIGSARPSCLGCHAGVTLKIEGHPLIARFAFETGDTGISPAATPWASLTERPIALPPVRQHRSALHESNATVY